MKNQLQTGWPKLEANRYSCRRYRKYYQKKYWKAVGKTSWFPKTGNPEQIIDWKIEKVNLREKNPERNKKKGVPFVVNYHPKLKGLVLSNMIKESLYHLYMNNLIKKNFTTNPFISFQIFCKISSYIVRAKLCPLERTAGSYK